MNPNAKNDVLDLMREKDRIENEIAQVAQIFTLNGIGMTEPLVDNEGFPLNSVDVYTVRHARNKMICLQNDYKAIMNRIHTGLGEYFSSADNSVQATQNEPEPTNLYTNPFVKITVVINGSPAYIAGLRVDDEVVEFGSINSMNFRSINDLGTVVQHSEGQELQLRILRENRVFTTILVPKKWSGKGLLGCNIVLMD